MQHNTQASSATELGPSEAVKWSVALLIALCLTLGSTVYVYIVFGTVGTFMSWSFISAAVASLLFATSFSVSSVSYYTGFPNVRHGYQKHIGVLGFWVSLFYSLTLLVLYPETYWYGLRDNFLTADVLFGLTAMVIFGAMVLINSKPIAPYFSWNTIRFVLGLGYLGYALLVMRAVFIEWNLWEAWLTTFEGFPPGRLVLSVIAIGVLSLRLSIPIHKALTAKPN
ncbi:hypothetical protein HYW58_01755 [Candidatus Kaiserbacteria bacterium]|nr:hypothetical protein [Candidatus Kaiserbacteria bacterium]